MTDVEEVDQILGTQASSCPHVVVESRGGGSSLADVEEVDQILGTQAPSCPHVVVESGGDGSSLADVEEVDQIFGTQAMPTRCGGEWRRWILSG